MNSLILELKYWRFDLLYQSECNEMVVYYQCRLINIYIQLSWTSKFQSFFNLVCPHQLEGSPDKFKSKEKNLDATEKREAGEKAKGAANQPDQLVDLHRALLVSLDLVVEGGVKEDLDNLGVLFNTHAWNTNSDVQLSILSKTYLALPWLGQT